MTTPLKMDVQFPRRRRGRPPKVNTVQSLSLEFPTSHLTEISAQELQLGYKLFKDILSMSKIRHLFERPENCFYGLHNYYSIILEPMWFAEVGRKYENQEYRGLKEVIDDLRKVLENCFMYWGSQHKFSKQAYKIENLMKKHVKDFPERIKAMLMYDDEETEAQTETGDSDQNKVASKSQILKRAQNKLDEFDQHNLKLKEQLLHWQSEVLITKKISKEILLNASLAEIGQILKISSSLTGLVDITQYELERMFMMPKESTTLASIMTFLLCPTTMRGNLSLKPIMVYEVWSNLLGKRLENWYSLYDKLAGDRLKLIIKHGFTNEFWDIAGTKNPLIENEFHNLSLQKKAVIVKELFHTVFHGNKKFEEFTSVVDSNSLRPLTIFEDNKCMYVSLFEPEIRVYRIFKNPPYCSNIIKNLNSESAEEPEESVAEYLKQSKKQQILVANTRESLQGLLNEMQLKKKKSVSGIQDLLSREDDEKLMLRGLRALYTQWTRFNNKTENMLNLSIDYWIKKEGSDSPRKKEENQEGEEQVLGKRISKKKSLPEDMESSSNDENLSESSVSDWEDGNLRRSRRSQRCKTMPRFFDRKFMNFERKLDDIPVHLKAENLKSTPSPVPRLHCGRPSLKHSLDRQKLPFNRRPVFQRRRPIINGVEITQAEYEEKLNDPTVLVIDVKNDKKDESLSTYWQDFQKIWPPNRRLSLDKIATRNENVHVPSNALVIAMPKPEPVPQPIDFPNFVHDPLAPDFFPPSYFDTFNTNSAQVDENQLFASPEDVCNFLQQIAVPEFPQ